MPVEYLPKDITKIASAVFKIQTLQYFHWAHAEWHDKDKYDIDNMMTSI